MASSAIDKCSEETVIVQLNELFGSVLHFDVIKRVAVSCHYDVLESSNKLLEITSIGNGIGKVENKINPMSSNVPLTMSASTSALNKKSKKTLEIERTVQFIQVGYKVLILMRGLPGCGKSYLAKNILESTIGFDANHKLHILGTDDFFYKNDVYEYDPNKIPEAHGWNHNRAFQAMSRGFSPVIIDNTNIQMWEMKPYAMMATDYGYIIEILEPDTHWCFNEKELTKRNSHGVPKTRMREMLDRYEKNITPKKLLCAYDLVYKLQKPPQMRLYPPPNINSNVPINSENKHSITNGATQNNNLLKSKSVSVLNDQTVDSKDKAVEAINLMDFNDDVSVKLRPSNKMIGGEFTSSYEQNPVDKILMYNNKTSSANSEPLYVLQPLQEKENEVIIISTDDENEASEVETDLFPNIESAWGVNANALRSWDIVTPLKDEVGAIKKTYKQPSNKQQILTSDSSSNTEEELFEIIRNKQFGNTDFKVLSTLNRDINRSTPKREPPVLKKPMHDKSCLTDDIYDDYDNHMSQLVSLFPSIPKTHLSYWYNKCKGDLEWTIEFLLEVKEVNTLIDDINIKEEVSEEDNSIISDTLNIGQSQIGNVQEHKSKRVRKNSDENKDLKKLIESKIDINDEHYSKHLLKIKQYKFRNGSITAENSRGNNIAQPNTTRSPPCQDSNLPSTSKEERCILEEGEVIVIDDDMEFDEIDIDESTGKVEKVPEETVELNLGENFVSQLENKFGENMAYPKGFQPVVQVPVTLARQLYTFYIESVYQQMENQNQVLDTLVKEDEEFAKKLQEEEKVSQKLRSTPETTPDFHEIMNEQVVQSIFQKEADKWKNLNPDTLAARLTRQKLFEVFPTINKDTLIEILYAHDNKYQDTVETLIASTGIQNIVGNPESIKEPPIKDEILAEMKEARKNCKSREDNERHEAIFYREEANKYLKKRAELYQKAQQFHQRGMTEVAQFYSGLASQQTIYYDRANSMAATAFLDEHAKRLEDFNTLDLHFLYVKEAMPALDVFLDRNINLLRLSKKQSEYLQIITGRGKRSENGVSKIKPAVITRLTKRKIGYMQLNPGLLKVKITRSSQVTSEL